MTDMPKGLLREKIKFFPEKCGLDCPWCDDGLDGRWESISSQLRNMDTWGHPQVEEGSWPTLVLDTSEAIQNIIIWIFVFMSLVGWKGVYYYIRIISKPLIFVLEGCDHCGPNINLFCWQMQLRTVFVNNACRQLIQRWVTLCKIIPLYQHKLKLINFNGLLGTLSASR